MGERGGVRQVVQVPGLHIFEMGMGGECVGGDGDGEGEGVVEGSGCGGGKSVVEYAEVWPKHASSSRRCQATPCFE